MNVRVTLTTPPGVEFPEPAGTEFLRSECERRLAMALSDPDVPADDVPALARYLTRRLLPGPLEVAVSFEEDGTLLVAAEVTAAH